MRANTIEAHRSAGPAMIMALAFATLAVLLSVTPASAAARSPFAGEVIYKGQAADTAAPEASALAGFRVHRTLRPIRTIVQAAARPSFRTFTSTRIVLTPRTVAANSPGGRMGLDLSEDVPVAPALMVRTNWVEAGQPVAQDNPFTLVGNRAGLVNATQTEVRGGEVWLTTDPEPPVTRGTGTAQSGVH